MMPRLMLYKAYISSILGMQKRISCYWIYCSGQQMWPELINLLLVVGSHNQLSQEQLAQQQQLAYGRAFSATRRQDGSAAKSSLGPTSLFVEQSAKEYHQPRPKYYYLH